ncbi:disulfide bond formation protein B [Candidatus Peregrinibacteria bacterium]|nr:MAG: disulfide bond formation protein B [Candidatus Peregrinibacteria bacterium]
MKTSFQSKYIIYLSWIQSLVATLGSLYFSEVMDLPPCVLCWYQRIAMYPLVFILAVGILTRDVKVYLYALPLSLIGFGIAVYHNLLYWEIIPESLAPCRAGISCTTKFFEWFGFITIPFMSLTAFTVITVSLLLFRKSNQK